LPAYTENAVAAAIPLTGSPVKSFKSAFNTVVTHLTFTASRGSVSVFDGDGNQLASLTG
jgi:hypothetical protein